MSKRGHPGGTSIKLQISFRTENMNREGHERWDRMQAKGEMLNPQREILNEFKIQMLRITDINCQSPVSGHVLLLTPTFWIFSSPSSVDYGSSSLDLLITYFCLLTSSNCLLSSRSGHQVTVYLIKLEFWRCRLMHNVTLRDIKQPQNATCMH